MLGKLRAIWRLLFFAFGAIFYITRYLIPVVFTGTNVDRGIRLRKEFTNLFFWALNIDVEVFGDFPQGGGLLVCNHRSYIDPFLLLKDVSAMPVGKVEVLSWPIIGTAGKVSGAIFVDRSSPESRQKARQDITRAVKDGYFIINYAEGTTHGEPRTIDFKPGMFRDAAQESFPIIPVALDYQRRSDYFIGDNTFVPHFLQAFSHPRMKVRVFYGPPIKGTEAGELLQTTKATIDQQLSTIRQDWHQG
ncbi:MAG: lysophospholipid acyltransferase family protein [Bacteroidota bacterium]